MVSVYGAPELPRALPAAAARIRSKPPLAGALGASSLTMLPVWAVASPLSVASLAFTGDCSVLRGCRADAVRLAGAADSTVGRRRGCSPHLTTHTIAHTNPLTGHVGRRCRTGQLVVAAAAQCGRPRLGRDQ